MDSDLFPSTIRGDESMSFADMTFILALKIATIMTAPINTAITIPTIAPTESLELELASLEEEVETLFGVEVVKMSGEKGVVEVPVGSNVTGGNVCVVDSIVGSDDGSQEGSSETVGGPSGRRDGVTVG